MWPENWPSVALFCELGGQWRTGMAGPTALDYTTLFMRMERMHLDDDEWMRIFHEVRVLESAALEEIRAHQ